MLLGYECQELTVFRQLGNFASVYFTCTTAFTARLFFMDTIVRANEFVQQQEVVQNKETEIIMYYESRSYNRSRLFPEREIKGRVRN